MDDHGFVRLINFPRAKSDKDLEAKIAEWEHLFHLHGKGISAARKKLMFAEILPDGITRDLNVNAPLGCEMVRLLPAPFHRVVCTGAGSELHLSSAARGGR